MKTTQKVVVKTIVLVSCLFLMTNCGFFDKKDPKPEDPDGETPKVEAPRQIVEVGEAKMLYDTYDKRRVNLIQHFEDSINRERKIEKKFDVARYVQYDYKVIKQYMDYIEQEAKAAKVDISSLRIYFSNYPDDNEKVNHPRQNSVMLSPTTPHKGREYLFYINDSVQGSPKAVLLNSDFGPFGNDNLGAIMSDERVMNASVLPSFVPNNGPNMSFVPFQEGKSLTLNRGNSAPPPHQ